MSSRTRSMRRDLMGKSKWALAIVASVVFAACSDDPLEPQPSDAGADSALADSASERREGDAPTTGRDANSDGSPGEAGERDAPCDDGEASDGPGRDEGVRPDDASLGDVTADARDE